MIVNLQAVNAEDIFFAVAVVFTSTRQCSIVLLLLNSRVFVVTTQRGSVFVKVNYDSVIFSEKKSEIFWNTIKKEVE